MRSGPVCLWAPSHPLHVMPPYSAPERQMLEARFPQQSRRRAAVKISVTQLRMKFSAGSVESRPAARRPAATSVCPKHKMFYPRLSSKRDVLCFLERTLRCRVGTTNALYKGFAGAKPAWCDLQQKEVRTT